MTPDYFTPEAIKKFIKAKTPLYPGLVDEYFKQAPAHNLRIDYSIYHALHFTNYYRGNTRSNDFGGGEAMDVAHGVENALVRLEKLKDWLNLPVAEYEGLKHVEQEFLVSIGIPKGVPAPKTPEPVPPKLPVPSGPQLPETPPQRIPPSSPSNGTPGGTKPGSEPSKNNSGFWAFIRSLAGFLAIVNSVLWLLKLWLPAPVVVALSAVIKFIAELAAAHPAQAFVVGVSSLVATHAVALKINPPEKWKALVNVGNSRQ